jgi:hypothetical protein
MIKTNKLFSKYLRLFNEQEPGQPETADNQQQETPPVEPSEPTSTLSENEKYVIKILTNAFIFNPTLFDRNKQQYIFNKIENIKKTVNVPVSKVVDEVKKIISLDNSLRVESKTSSLINRMYTLLEQPADATEPQPGTVSSTNTSAAATNTDSGLNVQNKLNLTEIFPLYKELILKALSHVPSEEELMIIKPVVNEFGDSDPEKIVETIQNILSQSLEDKEVEDTLSNA